MSSTCSMATSASTTWSASRTASPSPTIRNEQLGGGVRRDDVRRDAAFDQPDGVVRASEQRIVRQRDAAQHHQRVEQLVDRGFTELGKRRMRGAAASACSRTRRTPRVAAPSRLSVGSPLMRNRTPSGALLVRPRVRRRCRALRRRRTAARSRVSPARAQPLRRRHLRRENAFRVARAAAEDHAALLAARKERRDAVEVRGEDDLRRRIEPREDVEAAVGDRLFGDVVAALAQERGEPDARLPPRGRSWSRCRRARA